MDAFAQAAPFHLQIRVRFVAQGSAGGQGESGSGGDGEEEKDCSAGVSDEAKAGIGGIGAGAGATCRAIPHPIVRGTCVVVVGAGTTYALLKADEVANAQCRHERAMLEKGCTYSDEIVRGNGYSHVVRVWVCPQ